MNSSKASCSLAGTSSALRQQIKALECCNAVSLYSSVDVDKRNHHRTEELHLRSNNLINNGSEQSFIHTHTSKILLTLSFSIDLIIEVSSFSYENPEHAISSQKDLKNQRITVSSIYV